LGFKATSGAICQKQAKPLDIWFLPNDLDSNTYP
jgi:hypothetical protein